MANKILKALKGQSSISDDGVIFEISVNTESKTVISALRQAKLNNIAEDLDNRLYKASAKALNELTNLALSAARSYVPYRSGILRNSNITKSPNYFKSGTASVTNSREIIISGEHVPPYKSQTNDAIELAQWLNNGVVDRAGFTVYLHRTKDSIEELDLGHKTAGSSTANWVGDAKKAFEKSKKKYLSTELADYFYQQRKNK